MEQSIELMKNKIVNILNDKNPSIFLFGSVVLQLFECGVVTPNTFFHNTKDTVIYWGTSGQRITNRY